VKVESFMKASAAKHEATVFGAARRRVSVQCEEKALAQNVAYIR
jgi:hypothetical protein